MIISGGARFFAEFEQERILCVDGSLGSGKTLITHMIALPYIQRGYRFVTNTSCVWSVKDWESLRPVNEFGQMRVIANVDEGGLYVRTARSVQKLSSFARKLDSYLIFSGKKLPHEDLTQLRLYLWFDFYKNFLLPFKVYRYDVKVSTTKSYHGYIWISLWQAYYGLYSTFDPGDYPEDLLNAFEGWTEGLFRTYRRRYNVSDLVTTDATVMDLADIQNTSSQQAGELRETLSLLERKAKRR